MESLIITLTVTLIKKIQLYKMSNFPEPSNNKKKTVELDFSNYATKSDLKNATSFDTSQLAKKDDLTNLKLRVDELDIDELKNIPNGLNSLNRKLDKLNFDKLKTVPVDLKKLSDLVKKKFLKKTCTMN